MPQPPNVAVYRFYDAAGALLYVGITDDPSIRWRDHAAMKWWWPEVARATVHWHADRSAATRAETAAIVEEAPAHNVASSPRAAERRQARGEDFVYSFAMHPADMAQIEGAAALSGTSRGALIRELLVEALAARRAA